MKLKSIPKKRIVLIIGLVFLFIALLCLQYINASHKSTSEPVKVDSMLVRSDVRYCDSNNASQEYDVYTPATSGNKRIPLVVHIHGGGWRSGAKDGSIARNYSRDLTAKGIAFVSVDYRLADEATYPAQNLDVKCAIKHIQENSNEYGVDPTNIVIMGDSAGGHLAALEGLEDKDGHIKGVVMLYGVSDLWEQITRYADDNALHLLGKRDETTAKQASPIYRDLTNAPPFLLVHGTSDSVVPASESLRFTTDIKAAGSKATYIAVDGANHGFGDTKTQYEIDTRMAVVSFIENVLKK